MPDIDLKPTEEMASNAARGLELRKKHGRGGTAIGVARARDLKNRVNLSPDTVRRMHSYFARHEVDKKGEGWGKDSAGYIAWLLWGGDAGKAWADRKDKELDSKEKNNMSNTRNDIAKRLGLAQPNTRLGNRFDNAYPGPRRATSEAARSIAADLDATYGIKAWVEDAIVFVDAKNFEMAKQARAEQNKKHYNPRIILKAVSVRPGAKAKFADAALNQIRNNAAISDKILTLVSKGLSVPQAIDSVLGEGTYKRIGSEVYDELKKAKSSRPGAKAKMGNSQVNDSATTADLIREAQRLRDVIKTSNREFDKTHLRQIKQELDKRGVLMPYGASEVLSARPGAKVK